MGSILPLKAPASPAENAPSQPVSPTRQVLADAQRHFAANPEQGTVWAAKELESLSKEGDEELLAAGLLHVAGRLKGKSKLEGAAYLYTRLAESEIPAAERKKALAEFSAITGAGGSFGQRTEFLLSRFQHDISDYRMIAPMLGATFLGQLAGTAALGRLMAPAASGSGGLLSSAWLARAGAASTGYLAEVSAFAVLGRTFSPQAPGPWKDDFARAALTVGALKFAGGLGQGVAKHAAGTPYASLNRISQAAIPQVTALTGLMAAHRLEEAAGLRPHVEGQNLFFESLASLVTLHVGSRLGRQALGENFHQTQAELAFRSRQLSTMPRWSELFKPRQLALAFPGGSGPQPELGPMMMMANSMGGNGNGGKKGTGAFGSGQVGAPVRQDSGFSQQGQQEARPVTLDPADFQEHTSVPPDLTPNSEPTVEVADPYIGQVIAGKFRIDQKIGEGGMGVVYKGFQTILQKPVAVKVLKPEATGNPEVLHRFLAEAQSASKIGNPHIVNILDFDRLNDGNGTAYLVMEFLNGQELGNLLNYETNPPTPPPAERIVPIFRQVAEGLSAAHEAGIVHRDLKPENIFIVQNRGQKDFAKILDFGIAKMQTGTNTRLTQEGALPFGTPAYMSPEQIVNNEENPVSRRSDIYSFGAVLYELTTGQMLFPNAKDIAQLYTSHMHEPPTPPRQVVANPETIPEGLEAIILKCLRKDQSERYQSMEEIIADLDLLEKGFAPQAVTDIVLNGQGSIPNYYGNGRGPKGNTPNNGNGAQPAGSRYDQTMYIPRNKPTPKLAVGGAAVLAAGALGAGSYFLFRKDKEIKPADSPVVDAQPQVQPQPQVTPTAPDAPPAPPKISVVLSVEPADAEIFEDDKNLGKSPVLLQVEKGSKRELVVRREGYKVRDVVIDGSHEKETVKLERNGRPVPSGNPRPKGSNNGSNGKTPKPKGSSEEIFVPWQ